MTTPRIRTLLLVGAATALITLTLLALLTNILTRKQEARVPFVRLVDVGESTTDPAVWGVNWPHQYDSYRRTVDTERTQHGGSEAMPSQKLDTYPWLRTAYDGYAFAIDYRTARGHAYMLQDQEQTQRVQQRPQPGGCLHCHASVIPAYRAIGGGDVATGFAKINAMPWAEARNLTDAHGRRLIEHPISCVDCHDPTTMALRISRPAFMTGIRALKAAEGIADYDVNRDATRHELRSYVCAQCHVEYYFAGPEHQLTYPWHRGLKVENIEAYYDDLGYSDWTHPVTGAGLLKAQHPEFELSRQGTHAQAGVACADCHMPYRRIGAMKVSDHHVRSPLLDVAASCQSCHRIPEAELLERATTIQDRTVALLERTSTAVTDLIAAIAAARTAGADDHALAPALALHRRAQWRLDFVFSENSHGFHAPQETARILAEAIDFARQGVTIAEAARR